jgi:hypothetical protein
VAALNNLGMPSSGPGDRGEPGRLELGLGERDRESWRCISGETSGSRSRRCSTCHHHHRRHMPRGWHLLIILFARAEWMGWQRGQQGRSEQRRPARALEGCARRGKFLQTLFRHPRAHAALPQVAAAGETPSGRLVGAILGQTWPMNRALGVPCLARAPSGHSKPARAPSAAPRGRSWPHSRLPQRHSSLQGGPTNRVFLYKNSSELYSRN